MFQINSMFGFLIVNGFLRCGRLSWRSIRIGWGSWIKSTTTIDRGSAIGSHFTVRGAGSLNIGRYCAIGESVRIITSNHDMKGLSLNYLVQDRILGKRLTSDKKDVNIGHDVWIGDGATLLPGIEVGNGAIIGAGAVVTHSVEPFKIVAGNPARVIRSRYSESVIKKIEYLAWWDMTEEEQEKYAHVFESADQLNDGLLEHFKE